MLETHQNILVYDVCKKNIQAYAGRLHENKTLERQTNKNTIVRIRLCFGYLQVTIAGYIHTRSAFVLILKRDFDILI